MAQKARKDLAKSNAQTLNTLLIGSLAIHVLFLLLSFTLIKRSWTLYLVLSAPSFLCQFVLEKSARPKYNDKGGLVTAGQDLGAPGLTEYMLDIVWTTWACVVLVVLLGDWAWWLWVVVPAYGAYKAFQLFGAARGMMGGAGAATGEEMQMPQNRKQRRAA